MLLHLFLFLVHVHSSVWSVNLLSSWYVVLSCFLFEFLAFGSLFATFSVSVCLYQVFLIQTQFLFHFSSILVFCIWIFNCYLDFYKLHICPENFPALGRNVDWNLYLSLGQPMTVSSSFWSWHYNLEDIWLFDIKIQRYQTVFMKTFG